LENLIIWIIQIIQFGEFNNLDNPNLKQIKTSTNIGEFKLDVLCHNTVPHLITLYRSETELDNIFNFGCPLSNFVSTRAFGKSLNLYVLSRNMKLTLGVNDLDGKAVSEYSIDDVSCYSRYDLIRLSENLVVLFVANIYTLRVRNN